MENYLKRDEIYLVTGATGFIAQNLIEYLLRLNEEYNLNNKIIAYARNRKKGEKCFNKYLKRKDFTLYIGELNEIDKVTEKINYIFHTACNSNSNYIKTHPVDVINANVIGTYNVLDYAKNFEGICKVIFFSSGAVYGNANNAGHDIREEDFFSLNPLDINNVYAESKRAGESIVYAYGKQYDLFTSVIRLGHTYGPKIDLNDGHVYSDFVKQIIRNEAIVIRGNGKERRAFTYVDDAIDGILRVAYYGKNGEAYNIANNDCALSIKELAQVLSDYFLKGMESVVLGRELNDDSKYANGTYLTDISKIKALGWVPKVDIIEGFRRTVQSFEEEAL